MPPLSEAAYKNVPLSLVATQTYKYPTERIYVTRKRYTSTEVYLPVKYSVVPHFNFNIYNSVCQRRYPFYS